MEDVSCVCCFILKNLKFTCHCIVIRLKFRQSAGEDRSGECRS